MFVLEQAPRSWLDVVVLPALAVFFGLLVYGLGARVEMNGGRAPWKWLGGIILLVGLYNGFEYFMSYSGSSPESNLYRLAVPGRKMLAAHMGAFFGPLLSLLGIVAFEVYQKRRPKVEL